jgi:hypothetical protein
LQYYCSDEQTRQLEIPHGAGGFFLLKSAISSYSDFEKR